VKLRVFPDKYSLAHEAASQAATIIRTSVREHGHARIIAATGASQFEFLDELTKATEIDWKLVELFHLDEYLGLPATHPASFRKYLIERLINKVGIVQYHSLNGKGNLQQVIAEVSAEIRKAPIDVAFAGIGENGHLALTTRLPTLRPRKPTQWWSLTTLAASSNLEKAGSRFARGPASRDFDDRPANT
jgi:glucosamine-6-phosphate deaminase